jgi:phosphoribosyl-dephospho-CoA transferase
MNPTNEDVKAMFSKMTKSTAELVAITLALGYVKSDETATTKAMTKAVGTLVAEALQTGWPRVTQKAPDGT